MFDIPIEDTINNCNDIFRFQIISHLGSTYEKCVQESEDGDIELQRNNRIYAGLKPSGMIIKVKSDGRRDSLANCPTNPIVDNSNKCRIEDINKEWYIEFTNDKLKPFLGMKKLEEYKKDELLELATKYNLDIDKKTKKADLIEILKNCEKGLTNNIQYDTINNKKGDNEMATKQELEERLEKATDQNEKLVEKIKELKKEGDNNMDNQKDYAKLLKKINKFREEIRKIEFVFDKELPSNLGGGEYYSIDQFYNAVQETAIKVGLDFSFETTNIISFEKELVKPVNKLPIHVATVSTVATLTDIDTGLSKMYTTVAQGSDTIDKAVSGASTLAFRQWFYKNFTPKNMTEEEIEDTKVEKSEQPKVPVYVPEKNKEEIKKEVVEQKQQESSDDEDIKAICENIMKVREKLEDDSWGDKTLQKLLSGELSSADILEVDLKVKAKMEKVGL